MKKAIFLILLGFISVMAADCIISYPRMGPPGLRAEAAVGRPPGPGYVWITGYWGWGGGGYHWVSGRWARSRPGRAWVEGRWEQRGQRWAWRKGHWK